MRINGTVFTHEIQSQPRCHGEGNSQGNRHAQAGVDRDGAHIWAHQTRYKRHGQQCSNHRQCRQNGRSAYFIDGTGNDFFQRNIGRQLLVAVDVFHHHNGVVHQYADGENKREQRHAIQRKAPSPRRKERRGKGQYHRGTDDHGFAAAQGKAHQQNHRSGCEGQLLDQLVGLLGSRLTIIACDRGLHIGGNHRVAQVVQTAAHGTRHIDRIFTWLLGDLYGDGWKGLACSDCLSRRRLRLLSRHRTTWRKPDVPSGLLRPVTDARNIAQKYGLALADANHQVAHILYVAKELTRFNAQQLGTAAITSVVHHSARGHSEISGDQCLLQGQRIHTALSHATGVQFDLNRAPGATQGLHFAHTADRLDFSFNRMRYGLKVDGRLRVLAPQRDRHDGHIVDALGFDHWREGAQVVR